MDKTQALNVIAYPVRRIVVIILLLFVYTNVLIAAELEAYPGAELVASNEDLNSANRRIILGSLKKINNILEPKSYIYVAGGMSSKTYYIPGERKVDKVAEFYEIQLESRADVLFSCHGRGCGSSNYWADSIFQAPILYGPEQYQSYYIGLTSDKASYIAIYVAQRGTRKIYVHEQIIRLDDAGVDLLQKLLATGRIVFPITGTQLDISNTVNELTNILTKNEAITVILVCHDSLRTGETIEDSMNRTLGIADSVRSDLIESGISERRLDTYGLGPLAPPESGNPSRLEVLISQ